MYWIYITLAGEEFKKLESGGKDHVQELAKKLREAGASVRIMQIVRSEVEVPQ